MDDYDSIRVDDPKDAKNLRNLEEIDPGIKKKV
jgi:hypothetical protein